ncbi:MAG: hypothetical protein L0K86_16125 [Actinomycetia bacterium]|nr:hypothetical protein [Actinomycetes bacterium]
MRGVDHYRQAEQQIQHAEQATTDSLEQRHLLCAQAHALLAVAAAHALNAYTCGDEPELDDWAQTAGGDQ